MIYQAPRSYFHTFESKRYVVGLSFCNEDDAAAFFTKIETGIPQPRGEVVEEKDGGILKIDKRKSGANSRGLILCLICSLAGLFGRKKKQEIGNPYDFKHTRHIGYDPDKGFVVRSY